MKSTKIRDYRFDVLRAIGLFAIMLAHVGPPTILFQLRNFDVPLMVLISGSVSPLSSAINANYIKYVTHSIYRLLAPTWAFLTFFFLFFALVSHLNNTPFSYSLKTIISSFDLMGGIGYVWIVRVFILIAFILPLIFYIYNKIEKKKFLIILFFAYLSYELLYLIYPYLSITKVGIIDNIFQYIIFTTIPFGCIAGLGLYAKDLKKKNLTIVTILFGLIFFVLFLDNYLKLNIFVPTQLFKYPPRIYYLSYAIFASFSLYLFSTTKVFKTIFNNKLVLFIGSSSLWIYLWHILYIELWELARINFNNNYWVFIVEFIIVVTLSVITTYFQKIIKKLMFATHQ